ncbi:serpin family protein [Candidatus Amarolinea aalborgensis]|jgi:serpin B|uniref:serpin family protein n=1 Tax=Candidatus Amarolinea aalborgensis TaxID=2249329 RepID=UPI003BF9B2F7
MRLDEAALARLVDANTEFAIDLYRQLSPTAGNLFFSPFSLSSALAMTYAGARQNTARQMAQVLHIDPRRLELHAAFAQLQASLAAAQESGQVQLVLANSLWPQIGYPFRPEFLALLQKSYGAPITPVDFEHATEAARQAINAWAEAHTAGKITELLQPGILDDLTRLVLVNAIYFKGDWASQFDPRRTQDAPFWLTASDSITALLMQQMGRFWYAEVDGVQALQLPYAGDAVSMIVFLPAKEKGLAAFDAAFTVERLKRWTADMEEREVMVLLPQFKLACSLRLDDTLKALGMTDAFDEYRADFSGMDGIPQWLCLTAVVQEARVEVNEQGTEAVAATAAVLSRSVPPPPAVFRADHPFVFLILDHATQSILFCGRVVNPS